MLEIREIEELLDNEEYSKLLSASQLVALLLALVGERKSKLETFCDKIAHRVKEEAADMEQLAKNGDDGVLSKEDAGVVVDDWTRQLHQMYETIAAARPSRHRYRYALVSLALNIAAALQPLTDLEQLRHQLAQLLLFDLEEKQLSRDRSDLRGFLVCVSQFSSLDQEEYLRLVEALKEHLVESAGPEDCLEIFLGEAEHLPPAISDELFNKAVLAFEGQKSTSRFTRILEDIANFVSSGSSSKTDNLTRLFSHCLREIPLDGLDTAGIIEAVSQQATVANMMRFYPQLALVGKLEREVTRRADAILDAVAGFQIELHLGSVLLSTLVLLHSDAARVERLIALHKCLTDIRPSVRKDFSMEKLKDLIKLRREELATWHKAADSVRKFAGKFDVAESPTIGAIMSQFSRDPQLRKVCSPREVAGQPIDLQLRGVSAKDLAVVEQHNRLYKSAVFRIVQDEVWQDSQRR